MATEAQYKIFKELYDEETKRYSDLDNKGKLYITIVTFYLGAIAFKFRDVSEFTNSVSFAKWFYLVIASMLVAALVFTVYSLRVRTSEGIADPEEIIANFGPVAPTNEEFFEDRIADLAAATNKNSRRNNQIADYLAAAGVLILMAGAIQFILLLIAIIMKK